MRIGDLAARWLVNIGMQQGPVHRLAKRANLCQGAEHFQRTHVFQPNGYLRTYQGEKLADSPKLARDAQWIDAGAGLIRFDQPVHERVEPLKRFLHPDAPPREG